jgi:hypothetical protein
MKFLEWMLYGKLEEMPELGKALAYMKDMRYVCAMDMSYRDGFFGIKIADVDYVAGRGIDVADTIYRRVILDSNRRHNKIEARKRRAGVIIELTDGDYHREFRVSLHSRTS